MNLGVVGSRNFINYSLMEKVLDGYKPDKIISGGADGADCLAWFYAKSRGISISEYLPEYSKYPGKIAPLKRNETIVKNSDFIIAFQKNNSRGTQNTINIAKRQGVTGRKIIDKLKARFKK